MGHPSSALRAGAPIYARSAWMPMAPGGPFAVQATKNPRSLEGFLNPSTSSGTELVRPEGFEPPTNGFGSHYSIRLSYERLAAHYARTAGVRVMGPGDTRPGQPLRHSRCDDTGLSARAVAGRHRTPRFKRTGSRRAAVWPSQAAVAEAACSTSHLTVSLGTRLSAVTAEPAWQAVSPAAAHPHQRPALAARNLDRCGQPHPMTAGHHGWQGIARIAARTAPTPRPHDHGRAALLPFAA